MNAKERCGEQPQPRGKEEHAEAEKRKRPVLGGVHSRMAVLEREKQCRHESETEQKVQCDFQCVGWLSGRRWSVPEAVAGGAQTQRKASGRQVAVA